MSTVVTPFIMLDGNAREAIQFYEKALGAQVVFQQTFGEAPDSQDLPEEARGRVAHSVLNIGGAELFVSDVSPGEPSLIGNRVNVCITVHDAGQAKRYFEELRQDGRVDFPLQEVYFSPAYGMVTDKFGVTFQLFTRV